MTNHDITHCFKLQKILKKKGIEWSDITKKESGDHEKLQQILEFLKLEATN